MTQAGHHSMMGGKRLPYDAEVEYLKGTGTQWIDTGVYGDENTVVQLSVQIGSYTSNVLFGCYNANGVLFNFFVRAANWAYFQLKGSSLNTTSWGGDLDSRLDIELGNNYCKDLSSGTIVMQGDAQSSFTTDRTLKWFYYDRASSVTGRGKIFFAKIYKSGVLVQDVIPVRKGTVGYLYDRVSGALFGNAGSGDFLYGFDKI